MAVLEADPNVRVRLVNDEFIGEHGGRLRAGTAVEVDQKTAQRWINKGIALPAEIGDMTLREQKLAQIAALQAEADELKEMATAPVAVRRGRPPGVRPTAELSE